MNLRKRGKVYKSRSKVLKIASIMDAIEDIVSSIWKITQDYAVIISGFSTFILVILTAFYLQETAKLRHIAYKNYISEMRPIITVDKDHYDSIAKYKVLDKYTIKTDFSFPIINIGRSGAKNINIRSILKFEDEQNSITFISNLAELLPNELMYALITCNSFLDIRNNVFLITAGEAQIKKANKPLIISVNIRYSDNEGQNYLFKRSYQLKWISDQQKFDITHVNDNTLIKNNGK